MNRSRPKLALRKETLRALSNVGLVRVVGGKDAEVARLDDITADKVCSAAAVAAQGG
jgi:hypothetical protein